MRNCQIRFCTGVTIDAKASTNFFLFKYWNNLLTVPFPVPSLQLTIQIFYLDLFPNRNVCIGVNYHQHCFNIYIEKRNKKPIGFTYQN